MSVSSYISVVKAHERLVLTLAILGTILWIGNRWINHSADRAIAKNAAVQEVLSEQIQKNRDIAQQVREDSDRYQNLVTKLVAQNQTLANTIAANNAALTTRQAQIKSEPLPEVSYRWASLIGVTPGEIAPGPSGGVLSVTDRAARSTVEQLESIPTLKDNLAIEQQVVVNKDLELAGSDKLVSGYAGQVLGLNAQLADAHKACDSQVSQIKATERRGKRNWFLRGLAIGGGIAIYVLR